MLAFPNLDHVERLQRRDDIFPFDACAFGNLVNGHVLRSIVIAEKVQQNMFPITSVGYLSEIAVMNKISIGKKY